MRKTTSTHSTRRTLLLSLAILLLGTIVCAAQTFPLTVVDDTGRELLIQGPPRRILSTGLAMDNILLSLVDPERVIGVTRFATQPDFGSYVADKVQPHMILVDQLSPEYVVAADPDLVLVAIWNDPDSVEQIRLLGYPVYTFARFDGIVDALDNIRTMGLLTGENERARELIAGFETRYGEIAARVSTQTAPTVLYWNSWGSSAGQGTVIDDIIRYSGGRNVLSEAGISGWPQIDLEFVLQSNPEVIITDSGSAFVEQLKGDPMLAAISAVRNGRVYHVDHMDALDHRLILSIDALARALHPTAFEAEVR